MNSSQNRKVLDKAVTYAFLSVVKEKSGNVTSLLSIFEELTEGIISTWTKNGIKSALIIDLQLDFKKSYNINIPIPTLRVILNKISSKYCDTFTIHNDDSFIINNFPNKDFTQLIEQQKNSIDLLFDLYNSFLLRKRLDPTKYDLLDYIENNKNQILRFFSGDFSLHSDNSQVQARFIKELLCIPEYNPIISRLFLGAMISSYIELDVDESMDKDKTLLLDTNFIVSLLDLHSIESFLNCKMLIEIARGLKYKIEVMPFTVDETTALLNRIALNLNNVTYFQSQDKDSIYNGCFRRNISASSLSMIARKFMSKLQNDYGIIQTDMAINNSIINEAKQSAIYKQLKTRINNPDGALHDATLLYYTQKLRKANPNSFADINVWFVTDARGFSETISFVPKNVPLTIRTEELLNIMWISHPLYNSDDFIKTTISKAISSTLNNTLPDRKMLKEIDKKLQVVRDFPINTKDCIQVAEALGSIDNQNLKIVLEASNQQEILKQLHKLSTVAVEKIQSEKEEKEFITKMAIDKLKKSFECEMTALEKIKQEQITTISIESRNEANSREIIILEELIRRDMEERESIHNNILQKIPIKAEKYVKRIMVILGILCSILFCGTAKIVFDKWNTAEPIIFLLSFVPWILCYFIVALTTKQLSIREIKDSFVTRITNKENKKNIFFINKSSELEKRIHENKNKIDQLKKCMIYN
jgi:hypothetical protein